MPIVPIPEGPSVAPNIPRAPSFPSIPQGGDAVAQGLSNIGSVMQKIAHEEQEKEDRVVLTAAQNELEGWDQNEKWNPDTGLFFKDGQAYFSEASQYDKRFSKQRGAILDRLSTERQRAAFGQWSDSHAVRARGEVDVATGKKRREFDAEQTQVRDRLIKQRAQFHYTDDAALDSDREELRDNAASFGQRNDWSPEQIELALKAKDAELYQGAIQRALADGFGGRAKELLDKHRAELEPEVVEQLEARIRAENNRDFGKAINATIDVLGESFSPNNDNPFSPVGFKTDFDNAVSSIVQHPGFADSGETEKSLRLKLAAPLLDDAVANVDKSGRVRLDSALAVLPDTAEARTEAAKAEAAYAAAFKKESDTDRAIRIYSQAFSGQPLGAPLPSDVDSRNAAYKHLRSLDTPIPQAVEMFSSIGQTMPPDLLKELDTLFEGETLDLRAGLSSLERVTELEARRIAGSLKNSDLARTLYDTTRGATNEERERVMAVLSSPNAFQRMPTVNLLVNGDNLKEHKVPPLDRATYLGDAAKNMGTSQRDIFDSHFRLHALRLMGTTEDRVSITTQAGAAAARDMKERYVDFTAPTPGQWGADLESPYLVDGAMLGIGSGNEPDARAIAALQSAMQSEISSEFGYTTKGANKVIGQYRPDLAFEVLDAPGAMIPVLKDGEAIGFLHWNRSEATATAVDNKSNPTLFSKLKGIMDMGVDRDQRLGDPRILWRPQYGTKVVLDMEENEDKRVLVDLIVRQAMSEYIRLNGRKPSRSNADQMAAFAAIQERIARKHRWDSFGRPEAKPEE